MPSIDWERGRIEMTESKDPACVFPDQRKGPPHRDFGTSK